MLKVSGLCAPMLLGENRPLESPPGLSSCQLVLASLSAQRKTHKPCFSAEFHALLKERPLFNHSSSVKKP